jgi:hypothetical protein
MRRRWERWPFFSIFPKADATSSGPGWFVVMTLGFFVLQIYSLVTKTALTANSFTLLLSSGG